MDELDALLKENQIIEALPVVKWPPKLAFDMAMGESYDTLKTTYELSDLEFERIKLNPAFRREVAAHEAEIREHGVTFKTKAKIQAEMYLEALHDIIEDPLAPASVKLDAIKAVVKWAEYEPKPVPATSITNNNNNNNLTKIEICWQSGEALQ